MATSFPTSLDALTNPTGSDTLASPDHAGQHSDSNDAVEALQTKVGVDSSAVVTSLDYKVAQKIDKTLVDAKGDLIVASAADTVGRLAVGATDGHVLTVNSGEASGIKWAAAAGGADAGMTSGQFYSSSTSNTNLSAVLNQTYYMGFFVSATTTFDRIAIKTHSNFSGTATVRLGIYNNTNFQPSTVVLDAGTVSCTAASTIYTITISQSLGAGFYWLAVNSQTNATTNTFVAAGNSTAFMPYANLNVVYNAVLSFVESSITGAFATAVPTSSTNNPFMVALRKQ